MHWRSTFLLLAGLFALLGACAPERRPSRPTAPQFDDPAAYCAAVGTMDEPDARYVDPAVPEWIAEALLRAVGGLPDAPADLRYSARWRCDGGAVMACLVGANLPCGDKADTDTTPTDADQDYCREHPNAPFIPAGVTGRQTVFAWRCSGAEPTVERTVHAVDRRGYQVEWWHRVEPRRALTP